MPKRKKTFVENKVNKEEISLQLHNSVVLIKNFIEQRVHEVLPRDSGRFKKKSLQTIREFTREYVDELLTFVTDESMLAEELTLCLVVGALYVHLLKTDENPKFVAKLFEGTLSE